MLLVWNCVHIDPYSLPSQWWAIISKVKQLKAKGLENHLPLERWQNTSEEELIKFFSKEKDMGNV